MIAMDSPTSPTRLAKNALLPAVAADVAGEVVGDQQVGRETHALPADVERQELLLDTSKQHRGDEQVEVAEEPTPPGRGPCSRRRRCG